jgi:sugar phosphate isomerase/epimerase
MNQRSRREFLGTALAAGAGGLLPAPGPARAQTSSAPNRLGMFVNVGADPDAALKQVADLRLPVCEIYTEAFGDEPLEKLRRAMDRHAVEVVALFTMGPGPLAWNHKDGPPSNGLVPRKWRQARVQRLKDASDFARRCGIESIETHCGFFPEDPNDPLYEETVVAIREAARHCRENGQTFLYHAGAETPVTMLRTIRDVGLDNQGIGLDTANGIMYGTGHPADALEMYGQYVRDINAKDALWPTDPIELGKEVPLGEGKVDFPRVIRKLRELRFTGPIIIEREISGPRQIKDIRRAKAELERLLHEIP